MTAAQILGVRVPGVERQGPETQGSWAGSSVPPSGRCRGPHNPHTQLAESQQRDESLPWGEPAPRNQEADGCLSGPIWTGAAGVQELLFWKQTSPSGGRMRPFVMPPF